MVNEENLSKLYESVLNNQELTTKKLKEKGFSAKDLVKLIDQKIIVRTQRGYYSFCGVEQLFYYGKTLVSMKEYDRAIGCFFKCLELDSHYLVALFQLFLRFLQKRDYEKALEHFECLYQTENKFYRIDNDYYLYLLSMVMELPESMRRDVKCLKLNDILVDKEDKRYEDKYLQNRIRIYSFKHSFKYALKLLNTAINKHERMSVQDITLKTLLTQAIEKQEIIKQHLAWLVQEKKYEEMIEYLENLSKQHALSLAEEHALLLAKDLVKIRRTGVFPEIQILQTDKLLEAIRGKNYELAKSKCENFIKDRNIDADSNIIYVLLTEICKEKKNNFLPLNKTDGVIVENKGEESRPSSCNQIFTDIFRYLMENDLENSFLSLKKYLASLGMEQYEFLIIDFIKLSLSENDVFYRKPMMALTAMARGNFCFDLAEYIQDFYEHLSQKQFEQAKVYLDIISKAKNLGQNFIKIEALEQELCKAQNGSDSKRTRVESSLKKPVLDQTISSKKKIQDKKNLDTQESFEYHFIHSQLETLYQNGILLLKPMDSLQRKKIHEIVNDMEDVVSFSIGSEPSRQVVLRVRLYSKEFVDLKELVKKGDNAYFHRDYDCCIIFYRKRLYYVSHKAFVYVRLGLAYAKKRMNNMAIDYLTIATELSKIEKRTFDFSDFILHLKGFSVPEEDKKVNVKMATDDFNNDTVDSYGVKEARQIVEFVFMGENFDEACVKVNLNENQKNIVALILAKMYYAQERYTLGDQYLKKVERAKNKSKMVYSLYEEVRINKRFYKNRAEEIQNCLIKKM